MNMKRFVSSLGVLAPSFLLLVAGCSASDNGNGNKGGGAGAGGSTGMGGSGGGTGGPALTFGMTGFVPIDATMLGVTGTFYKYGDGLGATGVAPGKCQGAGHTTCSTIDITIDAAAQKICAMGTAAAVESMDYSNMFGAGIGFDLNNPGGDAGTGKLPYNAMGKGVTGVGFKIEPGGTYGGAFRIEFPAMGQDSSGNGAEDARFFTIGTSVLPAPDGSVEARFATATVEYMTTPPQTAPVNGGALLGFQWHVATGSTAVPFNFCLSHIHLLTN